MTDYTEWGNWFFEITKQMEEIKIKITELKEFHDDFFKRFIEEFFPKVRETDTVSISRELFNQIHDYFLKEWHVFGHQDVVPLLEKLEAYEAKLK